MIIRMWGTADQYDLTFRRSESGDWEAPVVTDLSDGKYACEIWAEGEGGDIAHWIGTVYIVNGCCVKMRLKPIYYYASLIPSRYTVKLAKRGECCADIW